MSGGLEGAIDDPASSVSVVVENVESAPDWVPSTASRSDAML